MTKQASKDKQLKNKMTANVQPESSYVGSEVVGYKLIWLIRQTIAERNITLATLSEITGISSATLSHIQTGRRATTGLEKSSIKALAEWLGIPILSAMLLAEQITPEDFYTTESMEDGSLSRAVRYVLSDPDWGAHAPREILNSDSKEVQMYLVWCYEQATKTKLLAGGVDYLSLIKSMDNFRNEHKIKTVEP